MISPSLQMETENEDTSDTNDSDVDDESVNIYEEALNCEDHSYEDDAINSIKWAEQKRQATYFHQVRQTRISLYFSFAYFRAHIFCRTIKNSLRRKS